MRTRWSPMPRVSACPMRAAASGSRASCVPRRPTLGMVALRPFCAERLAAHKIPRVLVLLAELPRDVRGKVTAGPRGTRRGERIRVPPKAGRPRPPVACYSFAPKRRDFARFSPASEAAGCKRGDVRGINVWRPVETVLTGAARLAWPAFQAVNRRLESSTFQPKWAPAPLLKSRERTSPPLGWPRETDSLCPSCVKEARGRILSGAASVRTLVNEHAGRDQGADRRARRPGRWSRRPARPTGPSTT